MLKLNIRAFFFNAQTDYLPYYKNFAFKLDAKTTLLEILNMIKNQNPDFSYPNKNVILKVNGLVLTADEKVGTVVEKLGTALQIDPALTYRSNNGLILNDDDFMQSFELLSDFTNDEDKAYYESLYPLHYASASFEYNHTYRGDALLVLASKLIEREAKNEEAILKIINCEFSGISYCEYENNLFHAQDHTQTINRLKERSLELRIISKASISITDKLCALAIKPKVYTLDPQTLSEQSITLYVGNRESNELIEETMQQVKQTGATFVSFPSAVRVSGQTLIESNSDIAHKKAGKMLLDALDHGADTLLFSSNEELTTFTSMLPKCERVMGRPISLNLISLKTFQSLVKEVEA